MSAADVRELGRHVTGRCDPETCGWHEEERDGGSWIVSDRGIHGGIPVLRGTRIKATLVASLVLDGLSNEEIRGLYPAVRDEHVDAVRAALAEHVGHTVGHSPGPDSVGPDEPDAG